MINESNVMDASSLKKFARYARRALTAQVAGKLQKILATDSAAMRENPTAVAELKKGIAQSSKEQVVDKVAYIWFNRFCALRFMDVNRYNRMGILSPVEGQFQPEILAEAKMGYIDEAMVPEAIRKQVFSLLTGAVPSPDPQGEAYRLLLVTACNDWHKSMPYMFEKISDYTELLMPDDLLSGNSILSYIREAMSPDVCEDVEVIGWLYQYYISEKKDEVFAGLKKGKKISPENIPAATQLFTPHWIVRYLVENSLGRLWLLNRPHSKLADKMDYYIRPEQPEPDYLKITSPEDLKLCDPACGSGHMLTYAFDLLYEIYKEEHYSEAEIPVQILTHNLYGVEIDERAASLAAFALAMKARAKSRSFFRQRIAPNICALENIHFEAGELQAYMDAVGRDLFTASFEETLQQFEEADNFGSLIRPQLTDIAIIMQVLQEKDVSRNLFLQATHEKVLKVLWQADYLGPKYHVVIANPPYMGGSGMNPRLKIFALDNYPYSKSDTFSMFIERNLDLVKKRGMIAMITMQSWMFLSSFEKLREKLIDQNTLLSMAHLGPRAFDSIGGEVVSTVAFIFGKTTRLEYEGYNIRLVDGKSEAEKNALLLRAVSNENCKYLFRASTADFNKVPGSPIAYWLSVPVLKCFSTAERYLSDICDIREGINTGDNEKFLRLWQEVSNSLIQFDAKPKEALLGKWFPHRKGGSFRKWSGNREFVINWENGGRDIHVYHKLPLTYNGAPVRGKALFFREALSWSRISTGKISFRFHVAGSTYDSTAPSIFIKSEEQMQLLAFLNGKIVSHLLAAMSPTLDFRIMNLGRIPLIPVNDVDKRNCLQNSTNTLADIACRDWDSYEISWDFKILPLLLPQYFQSRLTSTYDVLRAHWRSQTLEMQRLEEENNRIFIEAYGLQDELTPDVPLKEITLTCNPHYRYGGDKTEAELEALLLADTMKEFMSYAVGCMFGRYALEKPGLVLANQGETLEDYLRQVPEPSFPADRDNVIPIIEGDWFADDIAARFRQFLRLTFGEENFDENMRFIEEAIGKDISKYFAKDFYTDHVKRYKKRPIYWLFSSPKGSFNALIYMHRYRPDTVSVVLNDYLREYRTKLEARKVHLEKISISDSVTTGEKAKALKEIENLKKVVDELVKYEHDILYPLATQKLAIDLDDGVKVNYLKFGAALRKIPGLDAAEE
jgi:type II restriction/modification system DNA methylase subunit YeeA